MDKMTHTARGGQRGRALLAEDDFEHRLMMADILRSEGFAVTDGAILVEALEQIGQDDSSLYDVVVTDHRMPGAQGGDAINVFRRYNRDVPVMVVSAFADEKWRLDLVQNPLTEVLAKPFEPAHFVERLRTLCRRAETKKAGAESENQWRGDQP